VSARTPRSADYFRNALFARVRRLCLSLPETCETCSWGHPNFRAGKRSFLTFEHLGKDCTIAFYLDPLEIEELRKRPGFERTAYGQGRWVSLKARPRPKWSLVKALALRSYKRVALKRMLTELAAANRALSQSDEPLSTRRSGPEIE
jgi:predicted DNA-binding protein (MmcQ/YjbR family)